MKNLKALIKIERTPVLLMGIYFLIINLLVSIGTHIFTSIEPILIFYIGGILLLVYLQFKKDKSIEIGRFIKALPYTNGERAFVKIGMGLMSFTIPFLIYTVIVFCIRAYYTDLFGEIFRVTAYEEIGIYLNRISVYVGVLSVTYIRLLMIYLILITGEYLISHNIGSLVITVLSAMAPAYLWTSITYDLDRYIYKTEVYPIGEIPHGIGYYVLEITKWLSAVYTNYIDTWRGDIKISGSGYSVSYTITDKGTIVGLIYLLIAIVCSLVIVRQVKKQRIENADILLPAKVTRYIFIIGVAVCSGCLLRDLVKLGLNEVVIGYPRMILYVFLVIGLGVGAFVASKIANIGYEQKREV